jgi:hypothetical protein
MPGGPPSVVGMMQVRHAAELFLCARAWFLSRAWGSRECLMARSHTRIRGTAVPVTQLTRRAS